MRSVVNEKFLGWAVSTVQKTFSNSLITGVFIFTLLAGTQVSAQMVELDEYFCADDVSNVGSCTANEVSLSVVNQVSITDEFGAPIASCVAGQVIKIGSLAAALDSNTGERYDITFWIGRNGNDPRQPFNDDPTACTVTSLPDDTGSPNITNYEGNKEDNCLDFSQPVTPIELQFGGGNATFICNDSNSDGMADFQVLTTWYQNTNFSCGFGDQTPPYDITDPAVSPGSPSKCDFTVIETVPIVQAASLTIVKNTVAGATGIFDFTGAGFPAASTFDGAFQLDTTVVNPASLTDSAIVLTDPVNGDTYTIDETVPAGWTQVSASCSNGDDPTTGVTLVADDDVTCTFTNAPNGAVSIVKNTVGGDDTFSFTSDSPLVNPFDLMTIGGSASGGVSGLPSGLYQITESALAGWDLTGLVCVDPSGGSSVDLVTRTVTIDIEAGETITCTFTNTMRGQITLNKSTIPSSVAAFEFTHNIPVGSASPVDVNAGTPEVFAGVVPGSYTITESDPTPAYDLNNIVCVDGANNVVDSTTDLNTATATVNVDPGESVSCTFTNIQRGNLTVVKQLSAVGPASMDFDFTSTALNDFMLSPTGADLAGSDSTTFSNLVENFYDLAETDPTAAGWALVSATCDNGYDLLDPEAQMPGNVYVDPGDDVTCTFINSPLGSSTIIKNTVGGNDTFGFTGTAANGETNPMDGLSLVTVGGSDQADFTNQLHPNGNPFTVTEGNTPGWMLTGLICTEDGTADSTIDLDTATATINVDFAETVTCTFTNTADAQLIVSKSTVPGGLADQFTFTSGGENWDGSAATTTALADGDSDSQTGQPGFYMATETVLPGFKVTNITCTGETTSSIQIGGGAATFEDGDDFVEVTLTAGEVVTCDFENTALGSITVVKDTLGGDGSFQFNSVLNGGVFQLDTVGNTAERTFDDVLPGSYMIGEVVPAGWDLTDIECVGGTNSSYTYTTISTTVTLADGEDIVCTFTNTERGSITLVKTVQNDSGGDAVAADFQGYIDVSPVPWGVAQEYVPGDYSASEDTLDGYTASDWSGDCAASGEVTLQPGQDLTCNITNTDVAPTLQLTKVVNSTFGGDAQPDDFLPTIDGNVVTSGVVNIVDSNTALAINETLLTGYEFVSITGDAKCPAILGGTVTLDEGENIACTITNTDVAPKLTIVKNVINDFGGNALPDDFLLTVGGNAVVSGASNDYTANTPLAINETLLSGYTFVEINGDDKCPDALGGTVTLDEGDDITCSISNIDVAPTLTLTKVVNINHGGTAQPDEFLLTVGGNGVLSGVTNDYTSNTPLALNETVLPGYGFVSITGDAKCPAILGGSVTLDEGENVSCTITNEDVESQLTLIKVVNNTNGGTAQPNDFGLTVDGNGVTSGVSQGYPANTPLAINETQLAGYTFVSITGDAECPQVLGGTVTLANGDDVTCTITNADQPATLTLIKTVTNDHQGEALPTEWTLSAAGPTPISGPGGVSATPVDAGVYTLSEADGPDGYTAGAWDCGDDNLAGDQLTLANGDDVTCTIDNDDDPAAINLAKTVNGPASMEVNGTYTVLYTITATNTGGPGVYDLVDTFSPGTGITLNTATAVYVAGTENDQSGTLGAYPNFVTNEGLAPGLNESWTVTANFTVDPATVDPATSQCDPANPVINTGFYNRVIGSSTDRDFDDNDACTGLPDPGINLAKTVNGPATMEANGTYTVLYTITATNSAGPGSYDLVDAFSPGDGITLNTATAEYVPGTEDDQSGTLGAYPNFVTDEGLGAGLNESWTVTANFTVDPATVDPATSQCDPGNPVINTGFYNAVSGSSSDTDPDDNHTCTGLPQAGITILKVINGGGPAVPADFDLTLTGADGIHDGGVDYTSGAQPYVVVGVPYQVTETPGQVADYLLEGIRCVDDGNQAVIAQPFTLADMQNVTCTVTNYPADIPPPDPTIAVPVDNKLAMLLLVLLLMATGLYMRPAMTRKL